MTKTICIGLDGADPRLIERWKNKIPLFKKLMNKGVYSRLKSVTPYITPPAWASFSTGKKPNKHKVFGFEKNKGELVSSRSIKSYRFWNVLNEEGIEAGLINIPLTYPVEEIDGFTISSLQFTPDSAEDYFYPSNLEEILQNYRLHWEGVKNKNGEKMKSDDIMEIDYSRLLDELFDIEKKRKDVFMKLLDRDLGFYAINFQSTDGVGHTCWHFMKEGEKIQKLKGRYGNPIFKVYKYVAGLVSEVLDKVEDDVNVIIFSDHGMGDRYKKEYGVLTEHFRGSLLDWLKYFPRMENKTKLYLIKKMLRKVGRIKRFSKSKKSREKFYLRGFHKPYGIFFGCGPDFKDGFRFEGAELIDIAPTILHLMNCPVPNDMDGEVLKEIFREGSDPAEREIEYCEPPKRERIKEKKMDEKDKEKMKERLKGLGYLE